MTLYRKICKVRLLCVLYELLRWTWHTCTAWWPEKTPVWYRFSDHKFCPGAMKYRLTRPLYRHEHVYYNFDRALQTDASVKGFAFIFFMGIGDYLYTTPLWEALKKKYPMLPFYAYVGAQMDRTNSPLVGKLLTENPNFEKVFYFNGSRHPLIWKNYDYEDAFSHIPPGFLAVPVYYDYRLSVPHRVASLFETFGLPVPDVLPVPQMYFPPVAAPVVKNLLQTVESKLTGKKGIVFLQLDSRGSNYTYPHMRELANGLIREGYVVLSVTPGGPVEEDNYIEIDIRQLSINQTWQLLSLLKAKAPLYVISVNSVFWAASAGLELPNLGLQHWIDPKVHNLWYPNIEVITNHFYAMLPREKQIIAPPDSYTRHNRKIVDYKPQFILRCFLEKFGSKEI